MDFWIVFVILAIVNNAVIHMEVNISPWNTVFISFGCIPRSRIAGSYGRSVFNLLWNLCIVFYSSWTNFRFSPAVYASPLFTTSSPVPVVSYLLDNSHFDRCEMIFHYGFGLRFPDVWLFFFFLMCLLAILMFSLENCLFNSFAHVKIRFFLVEWGFYIFWRLTPYLIYDLQNFSPFSMLSFDFVNCSFCFA